MKVCDHIGKWGSRPRRQYWIAGLALTVLLALAMGCQQEPPAAAPAAPVDSRAAEAAAQAAQAAADAAQDAAVAAWEAAAAAGSAQAAAEDAVRRGEDRPTISVIGASNGTASVSASGTGMGTGSVSGVGAGTGTGSASGAATGAMMGQEKAGGLMIPTGLSYETEGPTASDGYYHPTTNREIYQKISTDYQAIAQLTNVISAGKPFPAAEIWLLYEAGSHTRLGAQSRTLRSFAAGTTPSTYFPESAEFYGSETFLDDPIENVIRGRGEAENYSDAQRRQAVNKGMLRILYHWSKFYMIIGAEQMRSGLIDEAWAVYVGEEVDGGYPNSLAALAQAREGNFGREGTIDVPLREAMERARQAAEAGDRAAMDAAIRDVYSRYNALFYLATVRYIGVSYNDVQEGKDPGTHQVEALAFYQSIQPEVANADPSVDETIMAYVTAEPDQITAASRDAALAALNSVAASLLLTPDDLVTGY